MANCSSVNKSDFNDPNTWEDAANLRPLTNPNEDALRLRLLMSLIKIVRSEPTRLALSLAASG